MQEIRMNSVRVLGSFESGLIIQAERPTHLNNPPFGE